ncbi:MAG: DUF3089 domain-containing protein [Gammaproteobacteria bacterium]|nr:DUF3089 domain-containing protein [Gammaproteobacteria bacterium]
MKKFLIVLAIVIVVLAALAYFNRSSLGFLAMMVMLEPDHAFVDAPAPTAPDYALPKHWAALPTREDLADTLPAADVVDIQTTSPVDVFFVHPTTYYSSATWNQPLDDVTANAITDGAVMRGQASAFNSAGAIYAPRYRQATLYSFMDDSGNGEAALALAYSDVLAAFDYYVEHFNNGRPSSWPATARARGTWCRSCKIASPAANCQRGWSRPIRSASASTHPNCPATYPCVRTPGRSAV